VCARRRHGYFFQKHQTTRGKWRVTGRRAAHEPSTFAWANYFKKFVTSERDVPKSERRSCAARFSVFEQYRGGSSTRTESGQCREYGLSATGQEQAKAAGLHIIDWYCQANSRIKSQGRDDASERLLRGLVILSSDFLRAKETAEAVLQAVRYHNNEIISSRIGVNKGGDDEESRIIPIYQNDVIYDLRLRERSFGNCDGTADQNYAAVWAQDVKDSSLEPLGAESVHSVRRRVTDCVVEWNDRLVQEQSDPCLVVLVAHGDVLQILQTAFEKLPGTMHRTIPHLDTATLQVLQLKCAP
jgi:broad specificity phosphatase PhoE